MVTSRFRFGGEALIVLLIHQTILWQEKWNRVSRPDFLCLIFPPQTGLGGFPPPRFYRWYCSLQFASAGLIIQWFRRQRGILGVQITHKLLDCDGNHCSSQTMSSLWCPWCLAGRGKFFFFFFPHCLQKGNPIKWNGIFLVQIHWECFSVFCICRSMERPEGSTRNHSAEIQVWKEAFNLSAARHDTLHVLVAWAGVTFFLFH